MDVPVVLRRQMPTIQQAQQTVEVPPQSQFPDGVDEVPLAWQRQVPIISTAQKTVDVLHIQSFDRVHDVPVSMQRPVPRIENLQKIGGRATDTVHGQGRGMPVAMPRQSPVVQRTQKTVNTPQIQFIDASGGCSHDGTQTGPLGPESSEDGGGAPDPVHRQAHL